MELTAGLLKQGLQPSSKAHYSLIIAGLVHVLEVFQRPHCQQSTKERLPIVNYLEDSSWLIHSLRAFSFSAGQNYLVREDPGAVGMFEYERL
jgi:hypothetical protein